MSEPYWEPLAAAQGNPKITTGLLSAGPPASPNDGDIWIATNVDGAGGRWQFQYDAAWVTDAHKWKFIGGVSYTMADDGAVTYASTTYGQPTGAGAAATVFTAVRAGVYDASHIGTFNANTGAVINVGLLFGAAGLNLPILYGSAAEYRPGGGGPKRGPAITAGQVIAPIYAVTTGTVTAQYRTTTVRPQRIS